MCTVVLVTTEMMLLVTSASHLLLCLPEHKQQKEIGGAVCNLSPQALRKLTLLLV